MKNLKTFEAFGVQRDNCDLIMESLTELPIIYTKRLRDILNQIGDNKVAKILLDSEYKKTSFLQKTFSFLKRNKIKDIFTVIDLTNKNDSVSVIQSNRIIKSYSEIVDNTDKLLDINFNSSYWSGLRTEISIGRWSRRIINKVEEQPDSEIEKFVNMFKAKFDEFKSKIEIVEGEEIRKYYLYSSYESKGGSLNSSCMNVDTLVQAGRFDLYVKNPNVCKLIILRYKNSDKIIGRALLWKLENGEYYMDNPYTIYQSDYYIFLNFAKKNGYLSYKDKESYTLIVKLDKINVSTPYIDTFTWFNYDEKRISNKNLGKGWSPI